VTSRDGFTNPNSADVGSALPVAEADSGDFLLLGNGRYGVIHGCQVSAPDLLGTGSLFVQVTGDPNIVLVDGVVYQFPGNSSLTVKGPEGNPRLDLVVFDTAEDGGLRIVNGIARSKPVFPDITATMTPLAALYVPVSGSVIVTDKRVKTQNGVFSLAVNETRPLVETYSPDGTKRWTVTHDGAMRWVNDAQMYRTPDEDRSLTIIDTLRVPHLHIDSGTIGGVDFPTRIQWGDESPLAVAPPGVRLSGDIYVQNTGGVVWIYRGGAWVPLDGAMQNSILFTEPNQQPGPGWVRHPNATQYAVVKMEKVSSANYGTDDVVLTFSPPMHMWKRA
jgi:hypothetical protein